MKKLLLLNLRKHSSMIEKNEDARFGLAKIRLVMELCSLTGPQNFMLFSTR